MTGPAAAQPAAAQQPAGPVARDGSAPAAEARPRRRRWLWPVTVALVVIAVGALSAVLSRTDTRADLDPRSASPGGSRAVAEILRRQAVRVDLVDRSDAAVSGAGIETTIVLVRPGLVGPQQLQRLRDSPADLVLVEPDLITLTTLAPELTPAASTRAGPAQPACQDEDAVAAGTATGGGRQYARATTPGPSGPEVTLVGCYPDPDRPDQYSFVRVIDGDRQITVLGQREVIQNGHLVSDGNAALALRVLGANPRLRWYLPDPAELGQTGRPPALTELLPRWLDWVFWQFVIVIGILMLWRARRLGGVVAEPLPVVVRSAETVEGRARLYRAGRARARAAAVLRTAALRRLAGRLGVSPDAEPSAVAQLAAEATRRDPVTVHQLLLGDAPGDDAHLVRLAGELDALERDVAAPGGRAAGYGGPAPDHRHHRPDPEEAR